MLNSEGGTFPPSSFYFKEKEMKLGKWKIEAIAVVVLVVVGLGVWWLIATKDERATNRDTEVMIKYAQRQALEIAIIEQTSKLLNYKQQMAQAKQAQRLPVAPPVIEDANR